MSEQTGKPVAFGDPATEPVDLAQAFRMYEKANRAPADAPVEEGAAGDEGPDGSVDDGGNGLVDPGLGGGEAPAAPEQGSVDGFGGPADVIEPIDYDSRRREILSGLQQQAIAKVRKDFSDNGIAPCTIEDLYQRDENTGRVTFKNPDDPTRDFGSRAEAQQWCDAFNKQIEMRFRQEINKAQQDLMVQNAPTLRLIAFAPKFDMMSQVEKDILDDIIEGYEIKDVAGNIVGYNVDLDSAAAQARRIAQRIPQQQIQEEPAEQGKQQKQAGPAMDLPSGTGKAADQKEPETLGEAIKMFDRQQREKGRK